jgi:hypothetical protein
MLKENESSFVPIYIRTKSTLVKLLRTGTGNPEVPTRCGREIWSFEIYQNLSYGHELLLE